MNEIRKIISLYKSAGVKNSNVERFTLDKQIHKIATFFAPGNHYFYILNFQNLKMDYVAPGIKNILNIDPSDFSLEKYLEAIHPDYLAQVYKKECRVIDFINSTPTTHIPYYKFIYFVKFRLPNGKSRKVLHQSTVINMSTDNKIKHVIGVDIDMTGYKYINDDTFSAVALKEGIKSYYNLDITRTSSDSIENILSTREMEIVKYLSHGYSTKKIAEKLFLSDNTIYTHRKNILQKTRSSNTAELVRKYILDWTII